MSTYNGNILKNIFEVATDNNIVVEFSGRDCGYTSDKEFYIVVLTDANKSTRTREIHYSIDCKHLYTEIIDDIADFRRYLDFHYGNGWEW